MITFSTTNYRYLLDLMHANFPKVTHFADGDIKVKTFPDKEIYHQLQSVSNERVILIGGTTSDSELMELYDMASTLAKGNAKSLTIIIPYFGYSTMERPVKPGEIVKAKTRAVLLSYIPANCRVNIVLMDLHSEGIPYYFEGNFGTAHLYSKEVIMNMCKTITGTLNMDFVLASTDAGRAKWVESLANEMGVQCAIITKRRISGTETSIAGINADVKGKRVILYDDMIRTGGSLIKAGQAYLDAGAEECYAISTHAVLPDDSIFKLKESGVFKMIATTDTHPRANELAGLPSLEGFYKVYTVANIINNYIINNV